MENLGEGINYKWEGDDLHIVIDTSREIGSSRSGNNIMLATTHGNQPVETHDGHEVMVMVNVFVPRGKNVSWRDRMDIESSAHAARENSKRKSSTTTEANK